MRLLVVILNFRTFFRFVGPVLERLGEQNRDVEIVVMAPDIEAFRSSLSHLPYRLVVPAENVGKVTKALRKYRTVMAYIYWSFSSVQEDLVLERMRKKFFANQLGSVGERIKHRYLATLSKIFSYFRVNKPIALAILSLLRLSEKIIPADRSIVSHIREINPDIIFTTPSLYPQHYDVDYVKGGLGLKIPTITTIASWDHLSSKGLLTVLPDNIFLWGGRQATEAKEFHRVPQDRIKITGAPSFDWLFDKGHCKNRKSFYEQAKFPSEAPYILWAASAPGNCQDEKLVVKCLMQEFRKYEALRHYQILIRPHPNDPKMWLGWSEPGTVVWQTPKFPYAQEDYIDLYNSIHHAQAVTGLSTSVFLEAAILDRPCAIIKRSSAVPETVFNQTLHFQYLVESGYPQATEDEVDFARWLTSISDGNDSSAAARKQFVRSLIRPVGLECAASKVVADTIVACFEKASSGHLPGSPQVT
jgi:hypothetical protein